MQHNENSRVKIFNLKGKNSLIGVASKDGSNTYLENANFTNVEYPFTAYKKKEVYEFGNLNLNNYSVIGYKKKYIWINTNCEQKLFSVISFDTSRFAYHRSTYFFSIRILYVS